MKTPMPFKLLDWIDDHREHLKPPVCNKEMYAGSGFIVQENDFAGYGYPSLTYANRVLASHEFFHAVQAAYDSEQSSIIGEGSAVWATEQFDGSLADFEGFLPGFFKHPDRSLDKPIAGVRKVLIFSSSGTATNAINVYTSTDASICIQTSAGSTMCCIGSSDGYRTAVELIGMNKTAFIAIARGIKQGDFGATR